MPEMNGKELYTKIHNLYPHIRALFMSGYSDDILSKEGILKEGINYISKPFQVKTLESKIMEALISTSKCCND
ncbi:MAG: multi-sensor hybrid histidine kinase [uncultured bacterium]|nr:MAG: multi-sensor hybrid histidine kinase [uncultured bacterium]